MFKKTDGLLKYLGWFYFGVASIFFLYEMMLQVSPSVMTKSLIHDLHMSPAAFGLLSSAFYYSYTAMQLPAGIIYDRFGTRRVMLICISLCAIGSLMFMHSGTIFSAALGRLFIGFGAAFSAIGALVVASQWLSQRYFAIMPGLIQLLGALGAILGQIILAPVVTQLGWRLTIGLMAAFGFLLALIVALFLRDKKVSSPQAERPSFVKLLEVIKKPQTWYVALYAFATYAPILAFAALWGVAYLQAYYGINRTTASHMTALVWLGIGLGSPLLGFISDHFSKRILPLSISALCGLVITFVFIFPAHLPMSIMAILLFCFGLCSSGQALSFALVKDNNYQDTLGTSVGLNNMAIVVGGLIFQPLVGGLLGFFSSPTTSHAVLSLTSYRTVFLLVLPACYFIALLTSIFLIKETKHR